MISNTNTCIRGSYMYYKLHIPCRFPQFYLLIFFNFFFVKCNILKLNLRLYVLFCFLSQNINSKATENNTHSINKTCFQQNVCYQTHFQQMYIISRHLVLSLNMILLIFRLDDECVIKQMKISIDQTLEINNQTQKSSCILIFSVFVVLQKRCQ